MWCVHQTYAVFGLFGYGYSYAIIKRPKTVFYLLGRRVSYAKCFPKTQKSPHGTERHYPYFRSCQRADE